MKDETNKFIEIKKILNLINIFKITTNCNLLLRLSFDFRHKINEKYMIF